MRRLFYFFLLLTVQSSACSQDTIPSNRRKEISLNMTQLVTNILGSTSSAIDDEFGLFFKVGGHRKLLKLGLGADVSKQNRQFGTTPTETSLFNLVLSAGYERRRHLSKKWFFYSGIDLLFEISNENSSSFLNTGNVTINDRGTGWGIQIPYGIAYRLNDRITFHSDGQLSFRTLIIRNNFVNSFPGQSFGRNSNTTLKTTLPLSFYLNIRL